MLMKPLPINTTRFLSVTLTVITSVLMFSVNVCAQSSIEAVFPQNFDVRHQYTPYGYDDLVEHLDSSFKITNAFVGERVKVIAFYDPNSPPGLINRTRLSVKDYGCIVPICDRLEIIFSAVSLDFLNKPNGIHRLLQNITPMLYFRDPGKYATFLQSARKDGICSTMNPCYVLAAGTLNTATIDFRTVFGIIIHKDIIYLDTDKVSLFRSSEYVGAKSIVNSSLTGIK